MDDDEPGVVLLLMDFDGSDRRVARGIPEVDVREKDERGGETRFSRGNETPCAVLARCWREESDSGYCVLMDKVDDFLLLLLRAEEGLDDPTSLLEGEATPLSSIIVGSCSSNSKLSSTPFSLPPSSDEDELDV